MVTRESVEVVLARVRPYLQADGGDIEFVSVEGNAVRIHLSGVCARCPSAHMTLHLGIETALREAIPGFDGLRLS